jgi:hypothetical protein
MGAVPMPQDLIDRVNTLGRRSHAVNTLTFAWSNGTPVEDFDDIDDADDASYQPSEGSDPQDDDDDLSDADSHSEACVAEVDDDNELDEIENENKLDEKKRTGRT